MFPKQKKFLSKFEYEEEEEQKQEPRANKYKRKKKEKIVEDLRDSLSSSSSVIDEDYSLNIHTHDVYDDTEFEHPVYPEIVNDNSEEQYMFVQNRMHTQELKNDEDDEEYESDHCASSDHEHGKRKTDDEEYESHHCDKSDDENGGHKNEDKEYEMDGGDTSYDEDEDGGNKKDENDMVY